MELIKWIDEVKNEKVKLEANQQSCVQDRFLF